MAFSLILDIVTHTSYFCRRYIKYPSRAGLHETKPQFFLHEIQIILALQNVF